MLQSTVEPAALPPNNSTIPWVECEIGDGVCVKQVTAGDDEVKEDGADIIQDETIVVVRGWQW
jgi:hypothetical protein